MNNQQRCCRCYAPLNQDEQDYYGHSCEECEIDYMLITDEITGYDRWKRTCFYTLRCLRHGISRGRDALLQRLRELLRNGRRRGF